MTLVMYDSINVANLPADAAAYAGYTSGKWPTWDALKARFAGKAHLVSIAIDAAEHALCLDIEQGDATNAQAAGWVKAEHARNVARPIVYTSASNVGALVAELAAAGVKRDQVRVWSAHYTHTAHICAPAPGGCGFPAADATQWTDQAHGVGGTQIDESLVAADFFPQPPPEPITYAAVRLSDGVTRLVISHDGGKTMA